MSGSDYILAIYILVGYLVLRFVLKTFVNADWFYQSEEGRPLKKYRDSVIKVRKHLYINATVALPCGDGRPLSPLMTDAQNELRLVGVQEAGTVKEGKLIFFFSDPVQCKNVLHDEGMLNRVSTRILMLIKYLRYPDLRHYAGRYGYETEELVSSSSEETFLVFEQLGSNQIELPELNVSWAIEAKTLSLYMITVTIESVNDDTTQYELLDWRWDGMNRIGQRECVGPANTEAVRRTNLTLTGGVTDSLPGEVRVELRGSGFRDVCPSVQLRSVTGHGIWKKRFEVDHHSLQMNLVVQIDKELIAEAAKAAVASDELLDTNSSVRAEIREE